MEMNKNTNMKNLQIFFFLIPMTQTIHSQKRISDSDMSLMKAKIENEIADLSKRPDSEDYSSINDQQLCINFNSNEIHWFLVAWLSVTANAK